jgi:5-methylcytosine-specific restriction protein A
MAAIILTWNPSVWPYWDHDGYLDLVRRGETVPTNWSVGRHRTIPQHADAYFYLQGKQHGLIAHAAVTSERPYETAHFNDAKRTTNNVKITLDSMVPISDRIPRAVLQTVVPQVHWLRIQQSGQRVPEEAEASLAALWREYAEPVEPGPDEVPPGFPEGGVRTVHVNRYERDPQARRACLQRWGTTCTACGIDFGQRYGDIGNGYIHVHHLTPVSQMVPGYRVDPITDLRPLCPNCHAMVHTSDPPITPAQLKALLISRKS